MSINALPQSPIRDADIAFISRDVTGRFTQALTGAGAASLLRHTAPHAQPTVGAHSFSRRRPAGIRRPAGARRRHHHLFGHQCIRRRTNSHRRPAGVGAALFAIDGRAAQPPLGLRTVVVRRSALAVDDVDRAVGFDALDQVLPQADRLILACPLTDITRGLIDRRALDLLPPGAQLINVSRGEVVNEPDVTDALTRGQLAGAFLDVFAHEPLSAESQLWDLPNVIDTPHTAGHSDGHLERVAQAFVANLVRWLARQPMATRVG